MKNTVLHINQLQLAYNTQQAPILIADKLEVMEGELVVILGGNGTGKSTLIKSIANLIKPQAGELKYWGKSAKEWNSASLAKKMGVVLTNHEFSGLLGVEEFIAFGRYPFTNWLGKLKQKDIAIIEKSIQTCDIDHIRHKTIEALSDGERQKVFIARTVAQQSELMVLDEPTTHLDVKNTINQLRLLRSLSREEGKTILFSSHQFDLALQIADKVWLIDNQKVHQILPQDFYDDCVYQEMLLGDNYRYNDKQKRFSLEI